MDSVQACVWHNHDPAIFIDHITGYTIILQQ